MIMVGLTPDGVPRLGDGVHRATGMPHRWGWWMGLAAIQGLAPSFRLNSMPPPQHGDCEIFVRLAAKFAFEPQLQRPWIPGKGRATLVTQY